MKKPNGLSNPNNQVCLLKKYLYGLKHALRQWHAKLVNELKILGFTHSKNNYSLFTKISKEHTTLLAVYVDDILVSRNNEHEIKLLKKHLQNTFTIKDFWVFTIFLRYIEVSYSSKGLNLIQHKYTKDLLKESGIQSFSKVVTPLPMHLKLLAHEGDLFPDPTLYRRMIGNLNFLTHTHPNFSYTIKTFSQFMPQPRIPHWHAL